MATCEELFAAVRLLKAHCKKHDVCFSKIGPCELNDWCQMCYQKDAKFPEDWPDPEEGGGEE